MGRALPDERSPRNGTALGLAHGPSATRFPVSRLIQLIVLLQSGRCPNARRLAEVCEVSPRTVYRDLAILEDAGITVHYRSDRQGYELARGLFLQPPRLDEREVLALLVLCRFWKRGEDLGLRPDAIQAVDKLVQSLPEPLRARFLDVAEILGELPEPAAIASEQAALQNEILAAMVERKQVRLRIRGGPGDDPQTTKMAIYRMTRHGLVWCVVGRSSWHCRVTLVALDQVERAEPTMDSYDIPPRFNLERFLSQWRAELSGAAAADAG